MELSGVKVGLMENRVAPSPLDAALNRFSEYVFLFQGQLHTVETFSTCSKV